MHARRHGRQQFLRQPVDPLRQHGAQRRRASTPLGRRHARALRLQAARGHASGGARHRRQGRGAGPSPSRTRSSACIPRFCAGWAGYNLDIFFPQSERPYTTDNSVNMAHLLVGSEGTLAVTERLTLKLSGAAQAQDAGRGELRELLPQGNPIGAAHREAEADRGGAGRPHHDRAGPSPSPCRSSRSSPRPASCAWARARTSRSAAR